jgi:hypothetical protein
VQWFPACDLSEDREWHGYPEDLKSNCEQCPVYGVCDLLFGAPGSLFPFVFLFAYLYLAKRCFKMSLRFSAEGVRFAEIAVRW